MRTALFFSGKRFQEQKFSREKDFEKLVVDNSKMLFGTNTIYLDIKNRAEGKTLGGVIPDGILFDLSDPSNPEFYLVEVELAKHDFYRHIFPQITKFFAFYKNPISQNKYIERLHYFIKSNSDLYDDFKSLLKGRELYKSIKDAVENSQNILLIIDDDKEEIHEVQNIYTDTWGKMVRLEILKKYKTDDKHVLTLHPDFEEAELVSTSKVYGTNQPYTEEFHLENVSEIVKSIYYNIKNEMKNFDSNIVFNPQKYYISIKKKKNFAYFKFRKKKVKIVVMLPLKHGKKIVEHHRVTDNSKGVKNFYGGECINIFIEDEENINEVIELLKEAYNKN